MIRDLKNKGLSTTQFAEICDLDRKTVNKQVGGLYPEFPGTCNEEF